MSRVDELLGALWERWRLRTLDPPEARDQFAAETKQIIEAAREEGKALGKAEGAAEVLSKPLKHAYIGEPECVWCGHFGPNDDPDELCVSLGELTAEGKAKYRDYYFNLGKDKGAAEERARWGSAKIDRFACSSCEVIGATVDEEWLCQSCGADTVPVNEHGRVSFAAVQPTSESQVEAAASVVSSGEHSAMAGSSPVGPGPVSLPTSERAKEGIRYFHSSGRVGKKQNPEPTKAEVCPSCGGDLGLLPHPDCAEVCATCNNRRIVERKLEFVPCPDCAGGTQ